MEKRQTSIGTFGCVFAVLGGLLFPVVLFGSLMVFKGTEWTPLFFRNAGVFMGLGTIGTIVGAVTGLLAAGVVEATRKRSMERSIDRNRTKQCLSCSEEYSEGTECPKCGVRSWR